MEQFDTIVIGAGISGLTAARFLALAGQRVVVIEARDRVGGRLWSEHEAVRTTDVGGSWIHGIADSPVHLVTRALGMRELEFTVGSYQAGGRPIAYYGPDGHALSDREAAQFIADAAAVDLRLVTVIAASATGTSYVAASDDAVAEEAAASGWDATRAARVREYLYHRSEEQYGADATALEARSLEDEHIAGDEVVFPDGFDALAFGLADGLDVRLGYTVVGVDWGAQADHPTGSGRDVAELRSVVVSTAQHGQFRATRAIVTVPVGVLQSEGFALTPALPEPVAGALAGLTMNAFEKVFLRFPAQFWDDEIYAIRRQGDAAKWWHSWYDLTALSGEPTLLTFAAGEAARETRGWNDAQITASVMASLREIYGADIPEPVAVRVTRWQDDPFSHGAYAYMTLGALLEGHETLATPLGVTADPAQSGAAWIAGPVDAARSTLHLAGEATWQDDSATVTAAMCSGHRVAERILGRELLFDSLVAAHAK